MTCLLWFTYDKSSWRTNEGRRELSLDLFLDEYFEMFSFDDPADCTSLSNVKSGGFNELLLVFKMLVSCSPSSASSTIESSLARLALRLSSTSLNDIWKSIWELAHQITQFCVLDLFELLINKVWNTFFSTVYHAENKSNNLI